MKSYTVTLQRGSEFGYFEGFQSNSEVKDFLKTEGFAWSNTLNRWEQTYSHVDPYSDKADSVWLIAKVMPVIYEEELVQVEAREVA